MSTDVILSPIRLSDLGLLIQNAVQAALSEFSPPTAPQEKEFLSITETAEFLNLSKGTIYKLVHYKQIPVNKPRNGRLLFSHAELTKWIKAGRLATQDEISEAINLQLSK